MKTSPDRRPIVPEDLRRDRGPSVHLIRALCGHLLGRIDRSGAERVINKCWPGDEASILVAKSVVNPATITTTNWASQLAQTAVADFILGLGPASAGAALLSRGLQLSFDGSGAILVPSIAALAANATFVKEGDPIPVRQLTTAGVTLSPRKFAVIVAFTRDIFDHSVPSIEAIVRNVLSESVAQALDTALFDTTAGDATRPAGLRVGINATAASATTPDTDAMFDDLSALAAAVAPIAGGSPIAFAAAPKLAHAVKMRQPNFAYDIFPTSALAAGITVAIATNGLVSAIDPAPRFDFSIETLLHMETSPTQVSTTGTPNVVAYPLRSAFQTDTIALRLVFEVSWALRDAGALAWSQSATW